VAVVSLPPTLRPDIVPENAERFVRSSVPDTVLLNATPLVTVPPSCRTAPAAICKAIGLLTDPESARVWPAAAIIVPVPERVAPELTVPYIVSLLPEIIVIAPPVMDSLALIVRFPAAPISRVWLVLLSAIAVPVVAVLENSRVDAELVLIVNDWPVDTPLWTFRTPALAVIVPPVPVMAPLKLPLPLIVPVLMMPLAASVPHANVICPCVVTVLENESEFTPIDRTADGLLIINVESVPDGVTFSVTVEAVFIVAESPLVWPGYLPLLGDQLVVVFQLPTLPPFQVYAVPGMTPA
jgi:hypothetical protein